jgi:hypothetical protein
MSYADGVDGASAGAVAGAMDEMLSGAAAREAAVVVGKVAETVVAGEAAMTMATKKGMVTSMECLSMVSGV